MAVESCAGGGQQQQALPGYETVTGRVRVVRCGAHSPLLANRPVYLTVYRGSCDHFALLYPADTVSSLLAGGPHARPVALINLRSCAVRLHDLPAAAGTAAAAHTIHISSVNKEHLHFVIEVMDKDVDMLLDALSEQQQQANSGMRSSGARRRRGGYTGTGSIDTIVEEDEDSEQEPPAPPPPAPLAHSNSADNLIISQV